MTRRWHGGKSYLDYSYDTGKKTAAFLLALCYYPCGYHPILTKLLNCLVGSLACMTFFSLLAPLFGAGAAMTGALALAIWPTHVFFTSQNFKESWVMLLCYLALACALRLLSPPGPGRARDAGLLAVALVAVGFLKSYVMAVWAAAFAVALMIRGAMRWRRRIPMGAALLGAGLALASPFLYLLSSRPLFRHYLETPADLAPAIIPNRHSQKADRNVQPFSPQGISEFRHSQQDSDNAWAQRENNRKVATQLFVDVEFHTWWDVLAFLPKGMFYVLFMPLPGLYPLDGNLGRILAALENSVLLLLASAAAIGFWRGPKTLARGLLWVVFAVMAVGSALLEFDLGSATRHKLLYLPLLFPFAASLVFPLRGDAAAKKTG